jgi:hypothetical protein
VVAPPAPAADETPSATEVPSSEPDEDDTDLREGDDADGDD